MRHVILDAGHGEGTSRPLGASFGSWSEPGLVRLVCAVAASVLADAGVAASVVDSGPYRERNRLGLGADLYLSVHCDVQPASVTPYALVLHRGTPQAARRLAVEYGQRAGLRDVIGVAGSSYWPDGLGCIQAVDRNTPALLLELGSLRHAKCDRLWQDTEATGRMVAAAVLAWLGPS